MKNLKISIVCGDIKGKFSEIFSKINKLNEKNGPFDLTLCVGQFYSDSNEFGGADSEESNKYIKGEIPIQIPTYFIDSTDHLEFTQGMGYIVCDNLAYLGKSGVVNLLGYNVAYLSGIYDPFTYSKTSIHSFITYSEKEIKQFVQTIQKSKIDILLTCEWPKGILEKLREGEDPKEEPKSLSPAVSLLSKHSNPRYHFCGTENIFFERVPYKFGKTICRFIALANVSEKKHLYAVSLGGIATEPKVLSDNPFIEDKIEVEKLQPKNSKPKFQKKKEKVVPKCWFCLKNEDVETHLLVSIWNELYLAFPKGGITNDHLLIISVDHCNSYLELSPQAQEEFTKIYDRLSKYYSSKNKSIILFERNVISVTQNHMHFQLVPIDNSFLEKSLTIFEDEMKERDMKYFSFDSKISILNALEESKCENQNYYFILLPNGRKLIHQIINPKDKDIFNFGRLVCSKLLNCPERSDWKLCALTKEEEIKIVSDFKSEFKKG